MPRQELLDLCGVPDHFGRSRKKNHFKKSPFWIYSDIEFYFDFESELLELFWIAFSTNRFCNDDFKIEVDPWIFANCYTPTHEELCQALDKEGIGYLDTGLEMMVRDARDNLVTVPFDGGETDFGEFGTLILESGVEIFYTGATIIPGVYGYDGKKNVLKIGSSELTRIIMSEKHKELRVEMSRKHQLQ
jgi:hypothetical protein